MTGSPTSHDVESPVEHWLDDRVLSSIYSSQYWNDLAAERAKEWWIADGSKTAYARLRAHLEQSGLMDDYRIGEAYVSSVTSSGLAIADLASGIGWTSSLLSKLPNVGRVHAVEISQHRLELLFPQAVKMFGGNWAKISRNLGSFYQLKFENSSLDIVFLSSAFHHAEKPLRLLTEIDRVLRPGGRLILIGETHISSWAVVRRIAKMLLTRRQLTTNFFELFPPDDELGDHYYRESDYYFFAQMLAYRVLKYSVQRRSTAVVVLEKSPA
ncbi:MAG: methyltransferase domain-containing protein [Steroidobacteraceae bacterium]